MIAKASHTSRIVTWWKRRHHGGQVGDTAVQRERLSSLLGEARQLSDEIAQNVGTTSKERHTHG